MYDILLKFSMINNFGGAFTMKSLEEETYQELQYMQVCLSASHKAQELADRKNTMISRDNI